MKKRYPRDPQYGPPPRWGRLYDRFFPEHTDPSSRHTKCIAEMMRGPNSSFRALLIEAGYEPDHFAASMETTVKMLWETRAKLAALGNRKAGLADATKNHPDPQTAIGERQ